MLLVRTEEPPARAKTLLGSNSTTRGRDLASQPMACTPTTSSTSATLSLPQMLQADDPGTARSAPVDRADVGAQPPL